MIDRKIWKGDGLRLAEGNSFYGREDVVRHRPGYAVVSQDSEVGDPLVEIDGGVYIVKREDLHELNDRELRTARGLMTLAIPEALNGVDDAERKRIALELEADARSGL